MMKNIVFFETDIGPVNAAEFIPAQPLVFQPALRAAADRLAQDLPVEGPRAYAHGPNAWSLWLEDDQGDRRTFSAIQNRQRPYITYRSPNGLF